MWKLVRIRHERETHEHAAHIRTIRIAWFVFIVTPLLSFSSVCAGCLICWQEKLKYTSSDTVTVVGSMLRIRYAALCPTAPHLTALRPTASHRPVRRLIRPSVRPYDAIAACHDGVPPPTDQTRLHWIAIMGAAIGIGSIGAVAISMQPPATASVSWWIGITTAGLAGMVTYTAVTSPFLSQLTKAIVVVVSMTVTIAAMIASYPPIGSVKFNRRIG